MSMQGEAKVGGRDVKMSEAFKLTESVISQLNNPIEANATCVRLRGLPYRVTESEIVSFLEGCSVIEVKIGTKRDGRRTGIALVKLADEQSKATAIGHSKKEIGNRF